MPRIDASAGHKVTPFGAAALAPSLHCLFSRTPEHLWKP
jgi:hypothetical protein